MKKILFISLTLFSLAFIGDHEPTNSKEVAEMFAKYPTHKSGLCSACVEWDNPVYRAIADTVLHYPICSFYIYTKEHADMAQALEDSIKAELNAAGKKASARSGIIATWHCVPGQPNVLPVYKQADDEIGKPKTIYEIVLGHVQAWILCAYSRSAAIFSDVPDFNAGMQYQGQNIGTEIATENRCRDLVNTYDSVLIWGGCYGAQRTYTAKGITVTVPEGYWKVIRYAGQTECWIMPNLVTESQDMISSRVKTLADIINKLGFDPTKIFS